MFVLIRRDFDAKWQKQEAERFLQDKLDEIVNRRHVVAHTANCLNIARRDLQVSLRFLYTLARAIDDAVGAYISGYLAPIATGAPPTWQPRSC